MFTLRSLRALGRGRHLDCFDARFCLLHRPFCSLSGKELRRTNSSLAVDLAVGEVSLPRACSGCGAEFQTKFMENSGFLPPEKAQQWIKATSRTMKRRDEVLKRAAKSSEGEDKDSFEIPALPRTTRLKLLADDIREIGNSSAPTQLSIEEELKNDPELLARYQKQLNRHLPPSRASLQHNGGTSLTLSDIRQVEKHYTVLRDLKCLRCHQLSHYGVTRGAVQAVRADDFRPLLSHTLKKNTNAVILKIVDLFDFEGSMIADFHTVVGDGHQVLLVANKFDVIPMHSRFASKAKLIAWVKKRMKQYKVKLHSVNLVSAETGEGVEKLIEKVKKMVFSGGQKRDVYVVGATNVGKSTLINQLAKFKYLDANAPMTTANVPGTTMGMVAFPFGSPKIRNKPMTLLDTPGIINTGHICGKLQYSELRALLPRKKVHPVIFRLDPGQTIFIGAMARIDFTECYTGCFFSMYVSDSTTIHVTKTDNAAELYQHNAGVESKEKGYFLSPPFSPKRVNEVAMGDFSDCSPTSIAIQGEGWVQNAKDIVFPGVGWVSVTGSGTIKLDVWTPPAHSIVVRDPMLPFDKYNAKSWMGHDPRHLSKLRTIHHHDGLP